MTSNLKAWSSWRCGIAASVMRETLWNAIVGWYEDAAAVGEGDEDGRLPGQYGKGHGFFCIIG